MRKQAVLILSFAFFFASSVSADVYRWTDDRGTINFADDLSKVPADYRGRVEAVKTPRLARTLSQASVQTTSVTSSQGKSAANPPPIAQNLVREGDFAMSLVGGLKMGQAQSEVEAEDMLASAGITPKNGWIADYPVTPDIVGELQNGVGTAADSGKLSVKKDEAMRAFQDLVAQQGVPVRSDESQSPGIEQAEALPDAGAPPQDYPEYYEPSAVDNYYSDQGPPVVTYYPPPPDYSYMYSWVPYPFWCTGFWFPGFFVLHDFHRDIFSHGHHGFVSNHFRDPKTRTFGTIDPARRHAGNAAAITTHPTRGFIPSGARSGASSIVRRSFEQAGNRPATSPPNREMRGPSRPGTVAPAVRPPVSRPGAVAPAVRPPVQYRPSPTASPPSRYPRSGSMTYSRPTYGSNSFRGSFSRPGTAIARSYSPSFRPSFRAGSSGSHDGGSRGGGSLGAGGRTFSGGGGGHRR